MPYKDPRKKAANDAIYYETHKEACRLTDAIYRETHKEELRAYREAHREERHAYNRLWAATHLEQHRAHISAWIRKHPQQNAEGTRRYKARRRGALIGPINIQAIKDRDRMVCCICGKKVIEGDFSLDHSHPLSLGGPHSQENQRVAHLRCNSRRGTGRIPVQMVLC